MATKSITEKTAVVNLSSPKALKTFSTELKEFIVSNKLYTKINDKNFVHVEGWQFAGASMGVFPVVEKLEDVSPDGKTFTYDSKYGKKNVPIYKYRAEVKLIRLSDGETVGFGIAICSNEESKKHTFDEYAVASMAQTRAISKASRNTLGWIMKLAGYEPTTAEEAVDIKEEDEVQAPEVTEDFVTSEDLRYLVGMKLTAMSAADKVKFVKTVTGKLKLSELTDVDYLRIYEELKRGKENAAE